MKNTCFVDTVFWIALLNADDELHQIVDIKYKQMMNYGFCFVTSTSVLNEVANSLCNPDFRLAVVEFYKKLQSSHRIEIVFVDDKFWSYGWKLYEERSDKAWSLTDCISIKIMQERGLVDVLTNDRHFTQASFNTLFKNKES